MSGLLVRDKKWDKPQQTDRDDVGMVFVRMSSKALHIHEQSRLLCGTPCTPDGMWRMTCNSYSLLAIHCKKVIGRIIFCLMFGECSNTHRYYKLRRF